MEPIPHGWRAVGQRPGQEGFRPGASAPPAAGHAAPSAQFGRLAAAVAAVLAGVGFLAAAAFLWATTPQPQVVIEGAIPLAATTQGAGGAVAQAVGRSEREWLVDVQGGVVRPGLVRLPPGTRVGDAITSAGGFGPTADLSAAARTLNLAQPIEDGMKIAVPERGTVAAAAGSGAPTGGGAPAGGLIDVNTADQALLETLPGVGPVTAGKIIAARAEAPFATIEELRDRGVLGEATFEKLRALVSVGP